MYIFMGSSKDSIKGRSKGIYFWVVVRAVLRVVVTVVVRVYVW